MGNVIDLVGQKFGRLTVLSYVKDNRSKGKKRSLWHCKCDCGKEVITRGDGLKNGHTRSCGCLQADIARTNSTVHGLYGTKYYHIWMNMRDRCNNAKNRMYCHYGGRGIIVCKEWESLENFIDWARVGYKENLQLDRIDNNGNYEPSNCKWSTAKEQQRNKNNNRILTINGISKTASAWAEETGISQSTLTRRYLRGVKGEELFKKVKKKEINISFNGKTMNLSEWGRELGIKPATLISRYHHGDRGYRLFRPVDKHSNRILLLSNKKHDANVSLVDQSREHPAFYFA